MTRPRPKPRPTVPRPRPLFPGLKARLRPNIPDLLFPKIVVCNSHQKLQSLLSQERVIVQTSVFTHIHGIDPYKSPFKNVGKISCGGVARDSQKLSEHPYRL